MGPEGFRKVQGGAMKIYEDKECLGQRRRVRKGPGSSRWVQKGPEWSNRINIRTVSNIIAVSNLAQFQISVQLQILVEFKFLLQFQISEQFHT